MNGIQRRTRGAGNRTLRGRKSISPKCERLPLVHVTSTGWAREIIFAEQLETCECDVLGEHLVYFFALRPAYRSAGEAAKSDQLGRFPAVFLIDAKSLGAPYHVYPFDTGGAVKGVFGDAPNPTVFLEDYELEPTLHAAAEHIAWAFGKKAAYFDGELVSDLEDSLPQFDEVARSFLTVARLASSRHNAPDRRASSIEVAYKRHVGLKGNSILAVLPKQYLEDGPHKNTALISQMNAIGLKWTVYDWQPNTAPLDYQDDLTRILRDHLTKTSELDG